MNKVTNIILLSWIKRFSSLKTAVDRFLPESLDSYWQGGGGLRGSMTPEELAQVTVLEVLHDDAERLLLAAHAQHPRDVVILQGGQDTHVSLEVQPGTSEEVSMSCVEKRFKNEDHLRVLMGLPPTNNQYTMIAIA